MAKLYNGRWADKQRFRASLGKLLKRIAGGRAECVLCVTELTCLTGQQYWNIRWEERPEPHTDTKDNFASVQWDKGADLSSFKGCLGKWLCPEVMLWKRLWWLLSLPGGADKRKVLSEALQHRHCELWVPSNADCDMMKGFSHRSSVSSLFFPFFNLTEVSFYFIEDNQSFGMPVACCLLMNNRPKMIVCFLRGRHTLENAVKNLHFFFDTFTRTEGKNVLRPGLSSSPASEGQWTLVWGLWCTGFSQGKIDDLREERKKPFMSNWKEHHKQRWESGTSSLPCLQYSLEKPPQQEKRPFTHSH